LGLRQPAMAANLRRPTSPLGKRGAAH